jgi:hypothetical protein
MAEGYSLRIHCQPRPVLLHELPQYELGRLLQVVPARVLGEVVLEGNLWGRRVSGARTRNSEQVMKVKQGECKGKDRGLGDDPYEKVGLGSTAGDIGGAERGRKQG